MLRNQRGEVFVLGVVGLVVVVGLFTAYVTGHPLPWGKEKPAPVAVTEPAPAPVVNA